MPTAVDSIQVALDTHILDVPGLTTRAKLELISALCSWSRYRKIEQKHGSYARAELAEKFRCVGGLRVRDLQKKYPLWLPVVGSRAVIAFAQASGMTRVEWLALPYDEKQVIARLRTMDKKAIMRLPAITLGFLNNTFGHSLMFEICDVSRDSRYCQSLHSTLRLLTFRRLLSPKFLPRTRQGISKRFVRFQEIMRDELGFSAEEYPILQPQGWTFIQSLIEEDGLTEKEAARFLSIGIRRGFIPESALK